MVRRPPGVVARKVGISEVPGPVLVLSCVGGAVGLVASGLTEIDPWYVAAMATVQPLGRTHCAGSVAAAPPYALVTQLGEP